MIGTTFGHEIRIANVRIAAALDVSEKRNGVNAITNDQMRFIERKEGMAVMALARVDTPGNRPSFKLRSLLNWRAWTGT
jgi:2C-methyl-D-erythritol 2,4-cyclodiphosphate synthase